MQTLTLGWVLALPDGHAAHCLSAVVLPPTVTRWPAAHTVHGTQGVALSPSLSHRPLAHACFGVVPPAQYVPASQAMHCGELVLVAGVVSSVPAAHPPAGAHADWLVAAVKVPLAQALQFRLAVLLATALTYVPG